MKHYIAFSLIALTLASSVSAATPTATPSSTATPGPTNQIDDLKERLATKVAELRQTQKKAIYGTIKAVSVSTFTVETKTNDLKMELTDDIKVFQRIKDKRTELTTEDLAKDDVVSVFGDYDTGLDLLKAHIVVIQAKPLTRIAGVVTDIDREEFTVTVKTKDNQTYVVDIEKTTQALAFDSAKGLVKGGFSKLETGKTVHVIGVLDTKVDRRISASRIIDIGALNGSVAAPTPTVEATPTATASGTPKPTNRASGSPTRTPTRTPTPTP